MWHESKIIKIEQESPNTRRFWLKIEGEEIFQFEAGQFVTMDLPISDRRTKRWRSYSIASAPDKTNILEFCISHLEGGLGTTYLFDIAEIGTPIRFKGPDGAFVLKGGTETKIAMICTGTGVAPFRSMIFDLINRGETKTHIHLIFGARKKEDLLYHQEFKQLAIEHTWFRYDIALSREEDWTGNKGYVHAIYQKEYAEPDKDLVFYICGWSKMVDEAVGNLLTEMHYDRTQVRFELYG
jgi:NAD(P)H-flavin reductase